MSSKGLVSYADAKAPRPRATRAKVKPYNAKRQGSRFPKNVNRPLRAFTRRQPCILIGLVNGDTGQLHRCVGPVQCCHYPTVGSGTPDDEHTWPGCTDAHNEQEGRTKLFERRWGVKLRAICRRTSTAFYRAAAVDARLRRPEA